MMRYLYVFIRLGARHDENDENMPSMGADYVQREMNIQFTMVLLFQTLGTVIGICLGDILYLWWGSYQWAFASAGFLLLPIVPWLWFMLPETVLDPKTPNIEYKSMHFVLLGANPLRCPFES